MASLSAKFGILINFIPKLGKEARRASPILKETRNCIQRKGHAYHYSTVGQCLAAILGNVAAHAGAYPDNITDTETMPRCSPTGTLLLYRFPELYATMRYSLDTRCMLQSILLDENTVRNNLVKALVEGFYLRSHDAEDARVRKPRDIRDREAIGIFIVRGMQRRLYLNAA